MQYDKVRDTIKDGNLVFIEAKTLPQKNYYLLHWWSVLPLRHSCMDDGFSGHEKVDDY